MKKKYLDLTEDQKKRDVIFSSQLISKKSNEYLNDSIIHEVFKDDDDKELVMRRLKDDSFFNDSPYSYNLIRS